MDAEIKRLRLASCVKAIIRVHTQLDPSPRDSAIARKINRLKTALDSVVLEEVSEKDLERIEDATNRLLKELGPLYPRANLNSDNFGPLH
ncbi:MAG: hypothetical protein JRD68_08840 [Deltaproteobacteria bacterium]|nr:hypothetical protein [Deltaproteobacteria bacterium]